MLLIGRLTTSREAGKPTGMATNDDGSCLVLRGGHVIDPASSEDGVADIVIVDGKIAAKGPAAGDAFARREGARVIDARGRMVVPGLVDVHVHLREPGQEYKEDIESGSRAAVAGGFTSVCAMPNTEPVNDCRAVTELILERARQVGLARVFPVGAITRQLKGETLAEMGEMNDAGVVAVSDDGKCVMNAELMRRACEYARTFKLPLIQHCEDANLAARSAAHEGAAATRAGLPAQPAAAETAILVRDLELVALTGARYHMAHVSAASSVDALRRAKRAGLPVTAEVTPHHLTLIDEACESYDTATKCKPPLRAREDREALRAALVDGTIDCIATDHAPHAVHEKDLEYDYAASGMIGLETALSLGLRLVEEKVIDLTTLIARLTCGPARVLGLDVGTLAVGARADITVFDAAARWTVAPAELHSKSYNTPFLGWDLPGRVCHTVVGGRVVHSRS